jgi:acetoin utilization deacetylase AcuC-like enzyme
LDQIFILDTASFWKTAGSPIKGHLEAYESVEATENDYKRNILLILEGGNHHGKDKD